MAFIRRRGNCTALIQTLRENGRVKQRVIANCHGADSVPGAIAEIERQIENVKLLENWHNERDHGDTCSFVMLADPLWRMPSRREVKKRLQRLTKDREALSAYATMVIEPTPTPTP